MNVKNLKSKIVNHEIIGLWKVEKFWTEYLWEVEVSNKNQNTFTKKYEFKTSKKAENKFNELIRLKRINNERSKK